MKESDGHARVGAVNRPATGGAPVGGNSLEDGEDFVFAQHDVLDALKGEVVAGVLAEEDAATST